MNISWPSGVICGFTGSNPVKLRVPPPGFRSIAHTSATCNAQTSGSPQIVVARNVGTKTGTVAFTRNVTRSLIVMRIVPSKGIGMIAVPPVSTVTDAVTVRVPAKSGNGPTKMTPALPGTAHTKLKTKSAHFDKLDMRNLLLTKSKTNSGISLRAYLVIDK